MEKNEILSIVENKDGSATIVMNIDADTLHALAEVGLNKILLDAADAVNKSTEQEPAVE